MSDELTVFELKDHLKLVFPITITSAGETPAPLRKKIEADRVYDIAGYSAWPPGEELSWIGVRIRVQEEGRFLMDDFVPVSALVRNTNGAFQGELALKRVLANETIEVTFKDLSVSGATYPYSVTFVIWGLVTYGVRSSGEH